LDPCEPYQNFSTGGSPPFKPDSNTPNNTNEPYLDWLDFILNQTTIPQTISTSYGDDEQTVPPDYAANVCNGFAQLGAKGISLLFASGDFG
jgi:tripeptidyl-peptidase I